MCCEPIMRDGPFVPVGECPDCGELIDEDGDAEEMCNYSPTLCETCQYSPCDGSC